MEIIFNKNQIKDAVNFVLKNKKFLIIRIDGEIGSGKTTLIKSLCESLGVLQNVSSPTFSIVNEYLINEKSKIFHFDFFRIKNPIEALDIGLEDYLESNHLCILEWGQIVNKYLPKEYDLFSIKKINDYTRKLKKIK
ncbi:MAG: tRNA (adenosine(37)-N6)-threonylcarbamoyltransferase complex ATPase subunit type 1 TsaE [Flavobacteriaceae bacterium]|tara:strand:- start:739 stop:1149 length:411 start_codon:yes stop_codon:yes gene_type:complete